MGTKYYVSANVCHLASAPERPYQQAVVGALFKDENIAGTLMNVNVNGFSKNVHQFFNYAKNTYTLGLPSGHLPDGISLNTSAIANRINEELGGSRIIIVENGVYTNMTPLLAMFPYLHTVRGYNATTEKISIPPTDIIWNFPWVRALGQLRQLVVPTEVKLYRVDLNPDGLTAAITYNLYKEEYVIQYSGDDSGYNYGSVTIPVMTFYKRHVENVAIPDLETITWEGECLSVFYKEYNSSGSIIQGSTPWIYKVYTNLYPELAKAANTLTDDEYLPVVPLRFNNVDLVKPNQGDLYVTSKALLQKLKLDIHQIADKINANPDVGEIDHAYVMFGIDLQTEHKGSLRYLHDYFHQLWSLAVVDESDFITNIGTVPHYGANNLNGFGIFRPNTVASNSSFKEHGLNLSVSFDYITSQYLPGSVGNGRPNTIVKELSTYDVDVHTGYYSTDDTGYNPVEIIETYTRGVLYLYRQVEPNLIHKIGVHNLAVTNLIYGGHGKTVYASLLDVIRDDDEHNLVIPVQYDLMMRMSVQDRNAILADSLIVVVNSVVKVRTKWYESSWFKFLIIVVAIVITIYTGQAWVLELAATIGSGAYVAAAIMVLKAIAIAVAIDYAVNWLVDTFGPKLGIIGSMLMVAAAIITKNVGALFELTAEFTLQLTAYMLQIATALISSANEFLLEEGQKITNEYADFSKKLEDRYEELKTAQELLDIGADINPLLFTRPARYKIIMNEYPNAFYARCLGLVDNSMYPIHEEIPKFITSRLTLPTHMSIDPVYSFGV